MKSGSLILGLVPFRCYLQSHRVSNRKDSAGRPPNLQNGAVAPTALCNLVAVARGSFGALGRLHIYVMHDDDSHQARI
jgi:hypothetical protein